jgi:hypothetical protein
MGVWNAGGLPREVMAEFKKGGERFSRYNEIGILISWLIDYADGSVVAHVDPTSGFAFVATPKRVFAWNYQKVR